MTFRQFLAVVELRTKLVSLSTFTLAALYARRGTGGWDLPSLAVCYAAVLCVDMGTTAFNSYFDWWRGTDESTLNRESDKVLVHEGVSALATLLIALALFAAAGILGLLLAARLGWWILALGVPSLAAGFLYSGGPFPISRTPFGELFAGGFLGSVLFLVVYGGATTGGFTGGASAGSAAARGGAPDFSGALLASLPGSLMIAAILAVNNACDIEGDRRSGRKTLAVLLGAKGGEAVAWILVSAGFALSVALGLLGTLPVSVAVAVPIVAVPATAELRAMGRRGYSHSTKGPNMGGILRVFLLWSAATGICLAADILFRP